MYTTGSKTGTRCCSQEFLVKSTFVVFTMDPESVMVSRRISTVPYKLHYRVIFCWHHLLQYLSPNHILGADTIHNQRSTVLMNEMVLKIIHLHLHFIYSKIAEYNLFYKMSQESSAYVKFYMLSCYLAHCYILSA